MFIEQNKTGVRPPADMQFEKYQSDTNFDLGTSAGPGSINRGSARYSCQNFTFSCGQLWRIFYQFLIMQRRRSVTSSNNSPAVKQFARSGSTASSTIPQASPQVAEPRGVPVMDDSMSPSDKVAKLTEQLNQLKESIKAMRLLPNAHCRS